MWARALACQAGAAHPLPKLRLCCIEATGKKIRFLEHMTSLLGMSDVQLVHGRAEELALRRRTGWL